MTEAELRQLIHTILSEPAEPAASSPALTRLLGLPQIQLRQQATELLSEHLAEPAALRALMGLARDTASEVRQQAYSILGDSPDPEATTVLCQGLEDADYLVRATCAELLGGRREADIDELLLRSLQDEDAMVRATAAESLGRREAFLATPALRDLLIDMDQWVRYSAAESLSQIEADEPLWPLLMNANSADLALRQEALLAIGELGDRRAIPPLVKMLRDDVALDASVLAAFEKFHDPLTVPAIVELALFTDKPHLREQALIQAQLLSLPATLEALAGWLEPERPRFAQRAIEALHQLPTDATTPLFQLAVQHPDRWVCTVALITLEERQIPVAPDILLPLLDENIHDLVRAALQNLMRHTPEQALPAVETFSRAEAEWQRVALAENLHFLPAAMAAQWAQALLADASAEVREAVLRSVGHRAAATDAELLLSGSRDADAWVRQAAVEGLGRLADGQGLPRLVELLQQDTDFLVRAAAAEALGSHQDEVARQALTQALEDSKSSVRLQAAHALFAHDGPPALAVFDRLLADQDKSVVLAALHQLRGLEPAMRERLQSQLDPLRQAEDPQIRSAAAALN